MAVTQFYSDIEEYGQDNYRCDFSANMGAEELLSNVVVTLPSNFTQVDLVRIGRIEADGKTFVEDSLGQCAEVTLLANALPGYCEIKWTGTTNASPTRTLITTFGATVNKRS